jgi:hypothetical protein
VGDMMSGVWFGLKWMFQTPGIDQRCLFTSRAASPADSAPVTIGFTNGRKLWRQPSLSSSMLRQDYLLDEGCRAPDLESSRRPLPSPKIRLHCSRSEGFLRMSECLNSWPVLDANLTFFYFFIFFTLTSLSFTRTFMSVLCLYILSSSDSAYILHVI